MQKIDCGSRTQCLAHSGKKEMRLDKSFETVFENVTPRRPLPTYLNIMRLLCTCCGCSGPLWLETMGRSNPLCSFFFLKKAKYPLPAKRLNVNF